MEVARDILTVNFSAGRSGQVVRCFTVHLTDGATSPIPWFKSPAARVSSHYVIERDGRIIQLVEEKNTAWTNGWDTDLPVSTYNPDFSVPLVRELWQTHVNPNLVSITVECTGTRAMGVNDTQLASLNWLTNDVCQRYELPRDGRAVLGHMQFDSVSRPQCPGLTPAQWARVIAPTTTASSAEDAALESQYRAQAGRLGNKRFKALLARSYYNGAVLVCDKGLVATSNHLTAIVQTGAIDDDVTLWEGNNQLTRL
jgi:N-acetyl-anhydromuramyl-L-alanine amidase AmpD